jgi:hypothetical protein
MSGTRVRKRSGVDAGDAIAAVKRYSAVVDELIKDAKVKQGGPGKKGFGSEALQIDGKIKARNFLSPDPVQKPVDNTPFLSSINRFARWLFFVQS